MTVAHVPIIDLELTHYIDYMRSRRQLEFADRQAAYDHLLYTARWLDEHVRETRTIEGSLLRTVEM